MAKQRYVNTDFWDDKFVRSLPRDGKHLFMYLLTNPKTNVAGIYRTTTETMAYDTGIDEDEIKGLLCVFAQRRKVFVYEEEWVVLVNCTKHQKVHERSNIRAGIDRILMELPDDVYRFVCATGYKYRFMDELERALTSPFKALEAPSSPSNYSYLNSDLDLDRDSNLDKDRDRIKPKPLQAPSGSNGDGEEWEEVQPVKEFNEKIKNRSSV